MRLLSLFCCLACIRVIHADDDDADLRGRALAGSLAGTVVRKEHRAIRNDAADGVCRTICDARREVVERRYGSDVGLEDPENVKAAFDAAHRDLIEKLHLDYGEENFEKIFRKQRDAEWQYRGFKGGGVSKDKMARKLQMKLLKVMIDFDARAYGDVDGCDCANGKAKAVGDVPAEAEDASEFLTLTPRGDVRFVWATGGHSASAGHGNLFNESMTAQLSRDMEPVFEALGMNFVGRNYAMGGTSSGPEIALCTKSIFGDDIDVLTWDYGMTDGRDEAKIFTYGYRAALHEGRPAIIGMHTGGRTTSQRQGMFTQLEAMGIPAFCGDETDWGEMNRFVPDTAGLTEGEIRAMPPMVRNFKCAGAIEKGAPYCGAQKFNMAICPGRKARTSWHPGFKSHAMDGNRMALFLIQLLDDAISSEKFQKATDLQALYDELKAQEDADYVAFKGAALPGITGKSNFPEVLRDTMFRKPSVCHTGRLPSQIRYKGILNDNPGPELGPAIPGKEEYFKAVSKETAIKLAGEEANLAATSDAAKSARLAYENKERENCPVLVKPDYKEVFISPHADGWTHVVVPNAAERAEYGYDPESARGIVIICPPPCDWGRCPAGDISYGDITKTPDDPPASIRINGVDVTGITGVGGCFALRHADGDDGLFHKKNADGVFDITMKANKAGTYLRVSSFIVY